MAASRPRELLLVVLVPLLLFLLLAEVGLRAYLSRRTFYDVEMSRYARALKIDSPNPRIGHQHLPNGRARLMDVDVRFNSDGFRDDEYPIPRTGRRRIVFLGDSLTFGWGVEKPDTFESRLEAMLDAVEPTEIINFGTGNYNTTQEVHLFLDEGLKYEPDDVVVFYFINDAEPLPQKSRFPWLGSIRIVTFYWSRIKALAARWSVASDFREYYSDLYRDDAPGWRGAQASFLRLRDVCAERGIGLRVVLLPELHELADYTFAREHELVASFLLDSGIPVLDLAPAFRDETDPESLWVARDDAHPNARAHRIIAESSFEFLRRPDPLAADQAPPPSAVRSSATLPEAMATRIAERR